MHVLRGGFSEIRGKHANRFTSGDSGKGSFAFSSLPSLFDLSNFTMYPRNFFISRYGVSVRRGRRKERWWPSKEENMEDNLDRISCRESRGYSRVIDIRRFDRDKRDSVSVCKGRAGVA